MPKTAKTYPLPTDKAWQLICAIRATRQTVKAHLTEAEDELKDARRAIDELGVQQDTSPEFQEASARQIRAERMRDCFKARLKTLADKMDQAISEAADGQSTLFNEFDPAELSGKPGAKELYHAGDADGQRQLDERPVGEPPRPAAPPAADGVDEHLRVSVRELDLPDKLTRKCVKAGYETIAQLVELHDANQLPMPATLGCSVDEVGEIRKALAKYRKAHRRAAKAAEEEGQ